MGRSRYTKIIHHNPLKREYVDKAKHWQYSSARDYEGVEGLIEVERLLGSPSCHMHSHRGRMGTKEIWQIAIFLEIVRHF